jgi:hypothetical protein
MRRSCDRTNVLSTLVHSIGRATAFTFSRSNALTGGYASIRRDRGATAARPRRTPLTADDRMSNVRVSLGARTPVVRATDRNYLDHHHR